MSFDFATFGQKQDTDNTKPTNKGSFSFDSFGQETQKVDTKEGIGFGTKISDQFKQRVETGATEIVRAQTGEISPIRAGIRTLGQGAGFVGDIAGTTAIEAGKILLPKKAEQKIEETATKLFSTRPVQEAVQLYQDFSTKYPEATKDLEAVLNIGTLVPGTAVATKVPKAAQLTAKEGIDIAQDVISLTSQAVKPSEKAVASQIQSLFQKGIKPTAKKTPATNERFANQIVEAVNVIKENEPNIILKDASGEILENKLPQSIAELSQAQDQAKKLVYDKYNAIAQQAGDAGALVNGAKIASELDTVINSKSLQLTNPEIIDYAQKIKDRFIGVGAIDAATAQEVIQNYNNALQAFYRNPNYESATKVAIDAGIANKLRKELDDIIENTTGEQYQALKNQYAALKAIENDVIRALNRDARKNMKGLLDYTDIFTGGQMLAGILSLNPAMFAKGAFERGIKEYIKFLNDPNRAIAKMFKIEPKSDVPFVPKSQTGQIIKSTSKQIKETPNKQGGFVKVGSSADNTLLQEARKYKSAEFTTQQKGMAELSLRVAKEHNVKITKNGNLVLYHGTKVGRAPKVGDNWRIGSYFTSDPAVARQFAMAGEGGAIKIIKVEVPPHTVFPSGDGTYYTLNEKIPVK